MVSTLSDSNPVLRDLQVTPRTKTGFQTSKELTEWLSTKPATEWGRYLADLDIELDFFPIFGAILTVTFGLGFPWFVCQFLITTLGNLLLEPATADFIINHYMPAFKEAIKGLKLSLKDKEEIVFKFVGTILKILYAFLYQEIYVHVPFLYKTIPMAINAELMPFVNGVASKVSGFPQTDKYVTSSKDVYPGDDKCRSYSPHAVWHEESGNGFLEIVLLSDFINGVLTKAIE